MTAAALTAAPATAAPRSVPSQMPLLLLTLLVGVAGGWSLGAMVYPGKGFSTLLVQRGHERITVGDQGWAELEVSYPYTYAAAPNLIFDAPGTELTEQRPDGFKVRIDKSGVTSTIGWTAKGMPAQP